MIDRTMDLARQCVQRALKRLALRDLDGAFSILAEIPNLGLYNATQRLRTATLHAQEAARLRRAGQHEEAAHMDLQRDQELEHARSETRLTIHSRMGDLATVAEDPWPDLVRAFRKCLDDRSVARTPRATPRPPQHRPTADGSSRRGRR